MKLTTLPDETWYSPVMSTDNECRQGHGLGEQDDGDSNDDWAAAPPVPLFKLTPGITSTSHGIACAEVAGAKHATRTSAYGWLYRTITCMHAKSLCIS